MEKIDYGTLQIYNDLGIFPEIYDRLKNHYFNSFDEELSTNLSLHNFETFEAAIAYIMYIAIEYDLYNIISHIIEAGRFGKIVFNNEEIYYEITIPNNSLQFDPDIMEIHLQF